jgi:hypothetical protein
MRQEEEQPQLLEGSVNQVQQGAAAANTAGGGAAGEGASNSHWSLGRQ